MAVPRRSTARRLTTTRARARASVLDTRSPAPLALRDGASTAGERVGVRKTYKLFIGGAFPRTESGRAYVVRDAQGAMLANACRGTRKDIRDAVRAARKVQPEWADKTAANRSQILYRIAELMEGRRDQFVSEVRAAEGVGLQRARRLVDAAIDRWVWYAGWADKFPQILGNVNPVGGALLQLLHPRTHRGGGDRGCRGLVVARAREPPGAGHRVGERAVVLASESRPLPAITLAEVVATSDVPGGVVNVITGLRRELVPHLASHMDVNALDGFGLDPATVAAVEEAATENVKRFSRPPNGGLNGYDWLSADAQSPYLIGEFVEIKTVWHPIGV